MDRPHVLVPRAAGAEDAEARVPRPDGDRLDGEGRPDAPPQEGEGETFGRPPFVSRSRARTAGRTSSPYSRRSRRRGWRSSSAPAAPASGSARRPKQVAIRLISQLTNIPPRPPSPDHRRHIDRSEPRHPPLSLRRAALGATRRRPGPAHAPAPDEADLALTPLTRESMEIVNCKCDLSSNQELRGKESSMRRLIRLALAAGAVVSALAFSGSALAAYAPSLSVTSSRNAPGKPTAILLGHIQTRRRSHREGHDLRAARLRGEPESSCGTKIGDVSARLILRREGMPRSTSRDRSSPTIPLCTPTTRVPGTACGRLEAEHHRRRHAADGPDLRDPVTAGPEAASHRRRSSSVWQARLARLQRSSSSPCST